MSERTASPLRLQRPAWINEFRDFIMRGNVVDLAIGVIIGSAFTGIVLVWSRTSLPRSSASSPAATVSTISSSRWRGRRPQPWSMRRRQAR